MYPNVLDTTNLGCIKKANIIQRVQVEPDRRGWGRLMDLYEGHDGNRIKVAKEDIDSLLVFVRLAQSLEPNLCIN